MTYEQQIEVIIIKAYLGGVQRGLRLGKAIMRDDKVDEDIIRQEVEAVINTNRRKK